MICADDDAVWQALTVRRAQEFESLKPFLEQWIDAARGFATRCDDPKQKPTVKLAVSKMLLLRPNLQALAVAYQVGPVAKFQDGNTIEDAGSCIGASTLRSCVSVHAHKRACGPTTCSVIDRACKLRRAYCALCCTCESDLFASGFEKSSIVSDSRDFNEPRDLTHADAPRRLRGACDASLVPCM